MSSSETNRISTKEAASLLGLCEPLVRQRMREGKLKIGRVIRVGKKGSTREYTYLIYRDLVEKVRMGA